VLAISLSCCVVCVVGLVLWARQRAGQLRHILTMVLTEVGKLIMSIFFELGDLTTDARAATPGLTRPCCRADGRTRHPTSRAPV
jgi:hypothetical protein